MSRRGKKKGRPVSGWLILDKPAGMGSTEAVAKVKWLFRAEKAGHAGTLDPLASGMLPIALGEATKTVPYVQDGAKIYRFTVGWGEERATDDLEGAVTRASDSRPHEADIRALLPNYTGVIMQTPPQFSAVKIAGQRAYDLARSGEAVEIQPREIEIARFDILDASRPDRTVFEVECGKGTYVRSLARDLGRDLGCFGHIAELRRTEVAPFEGDDLVTIAELEEAARPGGGDARPAEVERTVAPDLNESAAADQPQASFATDEGAMRETPRAPQDFSRLDRLLLDGAAALEDLPQLAVSDEAAQKIRLGNAVILRGRDAPAEAEEACVTARGRLVAIGAVEAGMFKPKRVFGQ